MINSKTSWLIVLLGLQMTLTLIIFAYEKSTTGSLDAKPLITTEAQGIDELVISDKAGELRLKVLSKLSVLELGKQKKIDSMKTS